MDKVLVTGGAGFIGSNLVQLLIYKGYQVIVLDNLSTGYKKNLDNLNVEFIEGDIRNINDIKKSIKGVKIVFHLAANIGNVKSISQPQLDSEINLVGTINLLECAKEEGIERFVYSSSAAIYGELLTMPIDENHPINPTSPYGVSKLAAEKMVMCYGKLYNFITVCLRYFNVYGENQRFDAYGNVIPIFANRVKNGKKLIIYGDGEQTRDFVHAKDVAIANYLAVSQASKSEAYNVGCGKNITINSLSALIQKASDSEVGQEYHPARQGEVLHCRADIGKIQKDLKFSPSVEFENGIKKYYKWFKNDI